MGLTIFSINKYYEYFPNPYTRPTAKFCDGVHANLGFYIIDEEVVNEYISKHGGIVGAVPNEFYSTEQIDAIFSGERREKVINEEANINVDDTNNDKWSPVQAIFTSLGVIGGFKLARGLVKAVINSNNIFTAASMGTIEIALAIKGGQYGRMVGKCVDVVAKAITNGKKESEEDTGDKMA